MSDEKRRLLERLEGLLAPGEAADALPALAFLASEEVELGEDERHGALRRAMFLLAAGGDPRRGLELDGRAVTALADDLDDPTRRESLRRGLARLREDATGLPLVRKALDDLSADSELAWRLLACALLAGELSGDD